MRARVHITLKSGVLDPRGTAIAHALTSLGFSGVKDVRQGKVLDLDLAENDPEKARSALDAMCSRLLANPVIEDYTIEVES